MMQLNVYGSSTSKSQIHRCCYNILLREERVVESGGHGGGRTGWRRGKEVVEGGREGEKQGGREAWGGVVERGREGWRENGMVEGGRGKRVVEGEGVWRARG